MLFAYDLLVICIRLQMMMLAKQKEFAAQQAALEEQQRQEKERAEVERLQAIKNKTKAEQSEY